MKIWPGQPYPLGATYDGSGTNFAVFSGMAESMELCLFDDSGAETRLALDNVTAECFHGYFPNVGPGQRYGLRQTFPYGPTNATCCTPTYLIPQPTPPPRPPNVTS